MEIGIDIEEVRRFKLPRKHAFISRIFTQKELDYAFSRRNPEMHLCGMFCAKEAIIKSGLSGNFLMSEIEILHKENGKPTAKLPKMKKNFYFKISISHAGKYAVACAVKNGR